MIKRTAAKATPYILMLAVVLAAHRLLAFVPQVQSGQWTPTTMLQGRDGAAAVLLPNGVVLIIGGAAPDGTALSATEIFTEQGGFVQAAPMNIARKGHTATLLADGRVLVAGGTTTTGDATATVETYDSSSGTWELTGALQDARSGHTATLVSGERVVMVGGERQGAPVGTLEVYDSENGVVGASGALGTPRRGHAAAKLGDGRVVIVGGSGGNGPLASTEIFDPETLSISAGPAMPGARTNASAVALDDISGGRIFVVGGNDGSGDLASALVFDGTSFSNAGSLSVARQRPVALLLPHNNSVLVFGGTLDGGPAGSAELFRPWSKLNPIVTTGLPRAARATPAAAATGGDGVVLAGGGDGTNTAELYRFATVKAGPAAVTGTGWFPGETISLLLHDINGERADRTITRLVDPFGNFTSPDFSAELGRSGANYSVTAVGQYFEAQAVFADGMRLMDPTPVEATSTSVATSGSPSVYGTAAVFIATVTSSGSPVTEGTVKFFDGGASCDVPGKQIGADQLVDGSGQAQVSSSNLNVAGSPHNILACYQANANFAASGGSVSQEILKANATFTVTPYSVVYDDQPHSATVSTIVGVNGETGAAVGVVDVSNTTHLDNGYFSSDYWFFTGTANYNDIDPTTITDEITPAPSIVTLTCLPGPFTYNTLPHKPCTVSVTGVGGLNITATPFYIDNVDAGTATVFYVFFGDFNHEPGNAFRTFEINPAPSVTTVTCPAGPFSYTGLGHTPCSASVTGIGGLNLAPTPIYANNVNAGTATASYAFAGDLNHAPSNNFKTFTITPVPSSTTVTCPAGPFVYTGSAHTPCSATVTGLNLSLTVTPSYLNNVNAGTATASYAFPGDINHTASNGLKTFTIVPAPSFTSVTCPAGPHIYTSFAITPCSATVTGAGGLNLSAVPGHSNNVNAGVASASYAYAGDLNHESSSGFTAFTIDPAPSFTTVTCPAGPFTFNGLPQTPCSATVTGAGLSLTATPNYANNINAGIASASYSFAGDPNHTGSNGSTTFEIGKASSNVTVTCTAGAPFTYSGFAQTPCTAEASGVAISPVDVTASLVYANNTNAGSAMANASWAGDENHFGSAGSGGFTIDKASSTTTVTCSGSPVYSALPQTPCSASVAGVGGLSESATPSYANNIDAGMATASYAYPGDANHNGSNDSETFEILKAPSTTTVTCAAGAVYNGFAHTPCGVSVTGVGGLNVSFTPGYTNNTNAGTAQAAYTYAGDANHFGSIGSASFTIAKANAVCVVSGYLGQFDTLAHGASGSCTGVLNETLAGLNLGASFIFVPGGTAAWTFTDVTGNYNNTSGTASIVITTIYCFTGFDSPLGGSVESGNGGSFSSPAQEFNLGSNIPVKFQLNALNGSTCGAQVSTGIHVLEALKFTSAGGGPVIIVTPQRSPNGNQFKLTGSDWQFGLNTKASSGFSAGTWLLRATLADGSVKTVWIALK